MNKKFSTLMTAGLLMVGALFSNVNAQTNEVAADTKLDGSVYYYLSTDGNNFVAGTEVKKSDGTPDYTALNTTAVAAGALDDACLWAITHELVNGAHLYTFKNKKTQTLLSFQADGTIATATGDGVVNKLTWLTGDKYASTGVLQAVDASHKLTFSSPNYSMSTGTVLKAYTIDSEDMTAAALNANLVNGFNLSFDIKPAPAGNIFGDKKITAVTLTGVSNFSTGANEVYFMVKGTCADAGFALTKDEFKAAEFIAVAPTSNLGIHQLDRTTGAGFTFTTVLGKDLVEDNATPDKGKISANNARFTVAEIDPVNKAGQFSIKLAKVYASKKADDNLKAQSEFNNVYVNAITDQGATYVTTQSTGDNLAVCKFGQSLVVKAEDLLNKNAKKVVNIKFVSNYKADGTGEYGKYLTVTSDGSAYSLVANAPKNVMLDAPAGQWIITNVVNNAFTFTNRESGSNITITLNKTDKPGEYKIASATSSLTAFTPEDGISTNLDVTTIVLSDVTVDPMAGFANLSANDLKGLVRMKFAKKSEVVADELFVKLDKGALKATKETTDLVKWEVVKFDNSAKDNKIAVSDTIYGFYNYAYIDKDDKDKKVQIAEKADTIAVLAYAFKHYAFNTVESYLKTGSANLEMATNVKDVRDAYKYALKVNKNGSYALISLGVGNYFEYDNVVAADAKKASVDTKDANLVAVGSVAISLYAADQYADFSLMKDAATPSLEHSPKNVAFNALTGGFIAVGENNEGIVAPVGELAGKEELVFWLDTADSKAYTPSFYISKGVKADTETTRMFMYNAADSASYYSEEDAKVIENPAYYLSDGSTVKAIFRAASLVSPDTLATTVNGKAVAVTAEASDETLAGLNSFKYQIVLKDADVEGEYVIKSVSTDEYLYNRNGKLGFTNDRADALVVAVEAASSPVANEDLNASEVSVIAGNGEVTVKGAAGKAVLISSILGQTIANTVLSSDNATINVPAGIVIVAVDGEAAVKAIVK